MSNLINALLEAVSQDPEHRATEKWMKDYRVAVTIHRFSHQDAVDYADQQRGPAVPINKE